jgi:hypothetical protein
MKGGKKIRKKKYLSVKRGRSSGGSKRSRESNKSRESKRSRESNESGKSRKFRIVVDEETQMKEISNKIARETFTPGAFAKIMSLATGEKIGGDELKRVEPTDITLEIDFQPYLLLRAGNKIFHIEVEDEYDETLPERMLKYSYVIEEIYGVKPIQIVLFIGEGKPPPNALKNEFTTHRYIVVDVKKAMPELYKEIKKLIR